MIFIVMSQRQFALFMWLLVYNVKLVQMQSIDRKLGTFGTVGTITHFHLNDNDQCYT